MSQKMAEFSRFTNEKSIVLLAGNLIDGTGGPIKMKVRVRLADGGFVDARDMSDSELIDLSDYTVMPGLVNAHVHLAMSGTADPEIRARQLTAGFDETRDTIKTHLARHADFGVVAVRDGGDGSGHVLRYKTEACASDGIPTLIRTAGKGWHQPGRYGKLIGRTPIDETLSAAIRKNTDSLKCDHVKIVNSGLNSLKVFGKQTRPQFETDEMCAAVQTAQLLGLKTMVHANGVLPVRIATEAGCDSIEHGFFMGRDNLARMADRGVFWVPTACTMKAYAEDLGIGKTESDIAKKNLDHQLEQIRLAKNLGVRIAVGTDAGSLGVHHGPSIAEEIRLLMIAGFSIGDAVRCASSNGAELLGLNASGRPVSITLAPGDASDLPGSLSRARIFAFGPGSESI